MKPDECGVYHPCNLKRLLIEQALQFKEIAQIYPSTPLGNKAFQQYQGLLRVIRLAGLYYEFVEAGGDL